MTVTVCMDEAGAVWIENVQGDILARRPGGQAMRAITVTHNDVEFALRRLKRQLQQSGLLRELRRRRRKREGIRQTRKRARLAHS